MGLSGQSIEEVYSKRIRRKLATILNDSTHPLHSDIGLRQQSNGKKWKTASSTTKTSSAEIFIYTISNVHV